jgi:hypothetical protein
MGYAKLSYGVGKVKKIYCDVSDRRPSLLCNTLVVTRQPQYFHGYAHHSGILTLHGNQQLEGQCFGSVKEETAIHRVI